MEIRHLKKMLVPLRSIPVRSYVENHIHLWEPDLKSETPARVILEDGKVTKSAPERAGK